MWTNRGLDIRVTDGMCTYCKPGGLRFSFLISAVADNMKNIADNMLNLVRNMNFLIDNMQDLVDNMQSLADNTTFGRAPG